jgi:hypothetical protein
MMLFHKPLGSQTAHACPGGDVVHLELVLINSRQDTDSSYNGNVKARTDSLIEIDNDGKLPVHKDRQIMPAA